MVNGNWLVVTGWLGIAERDGRELGTNPFDYFGLAQYKFAQDKLAFIRFIILLASRRGC